MASKALERLYEDYWEYVLSENPTLATYLGDHRYDDRLEDVSAEAYHHRIDEFRRMLGKQRDIGRPVSAKDRLNYDLFERELKLQIESSKYHPYLLPITQQTGPHIDLPQLVTYHPFKTVEDYNNYTRRLSQFPRVFDQTITNLKAGIEKGFVQPRNVVEKIIPQLEAQTVQSAESSELYKPTKEILSTISAGDAHRIVEEIGEGVTGSVIPAYKNVLKFIKGEYLRNARTQPGVWALPNGRAMYAFAIRYHTTTRLTPTQIHKLGSLELSRIRGEISKILRKLGFKGTLQQFNDLLRDDKSNFYANGQDLLDGFKQILRRMDEKLPLLFGRLPESKYDFRQIERFRADSAPAAYYYLPPEDRSRPGYFYVNTYKPETRPKYTMEALAYHEAVPGHHLQLALQQELTNLPKFRRNGGYTAFIEGWALYAERLGKEIGFYSDTLSDFGRLTQEAWRAARLVVDTGIHSMKWSRDQAIKFLKSNTAITEQDVTSEVDRYIAWPGQALAYKIGQIRISHLRNKTEKLRNARFDLRKFHDELLSDGALPLDLLEKKMDKYMEAENRP